MTVGCYWLHLSLLVPALCVMIYTRRWLLQYMLRYAENAWLQKSWDFSWMFKRHSLLSSWPPVAKKSNLLGRLKLNCKFCSNRFYPLGPGENTILVEIRCTLYKNQYLICWCWLQCEIHQWCSIFAKAKCSSLLPSSTHVCCTCVYLWGSLLMLLATFVFPASQC